MNNKITGAILVVLILSLLTACAGHGTTSNALIPDVKEMDTAESPAVLWGFWDITLSEDGSVYIDELRHAQFALNAITWLNATPGSLHIAVLDTDPQSGYTDWTLNFGFSHPFPTAPAFTGFDVCGILLSSGDNIHPFDSDLLYPGDGDVRLLNPDGFTRWMNPTEFSVMSIPILGYTPGNAGTPGFSPTATLNGYMYFCDGLSTDGSAYDYLAANPSDRGIFTAGSTNVRQYQVRFPDSTGLQFQYAALAHWKANINAPAPPTTIPDDFPDDANAAEPVAIAFNCGDSDLWFDGSDGGGSLTGEISVLNWFVQPDGNDLVSDYEISFYCDAWSGAIQPDMTAGDYGVNWCTFSFDEAIVPTENGTVDGWVTISCPGQTYSNEFSVPSGADDETLAAHWPFSVTIGDTDPNPTEFWEPPTDHDPRFLFIHHSCGSGFLFTGDMWTLLENAGFEVHDRTYGDGWVGDNTDPNDWPVTFTTYYDDMMTWEMEPGEQYDIVAFKSCYPACNISSDEMLNQYYSYYATVKAVCQANPNALFVPWSPPPLNKATGNPDRAARARTFSTWLTTTYCEGEYNIAGFDCFDVLAGDDPLSDDFNHLRNDYSSGTDSHPNNAGDIAVAQAFTAWLTDIVWPD